MSKQIVLGDEASKVIKKGVDTVADAVKVTIGPRGRNVVYDRGFGGPTITNDGVSIAREIVLKDPLENIGANLIKEVAQKTNEIAGDGTTTSVILTQAIVEGGMKKISLGMNAIGVKNGIEKAVKVAVDELKKVASPLDGADEIAHVATISAESEEMGKIIADTVSKLKDGSTITVEESPVVGIFSEVASGMSFEKGYISHYMVTDKERMEAEMKDVSILVTDSKISLVEDIVPVLEQVMATGKREMVIIAEDVTGEALSTLILNKLRGGLSVLCIKAPGFGERKKDYLQDIAIATGSTFISSEAGMTVATTKLEDLGGADRVVSTKDKTVIVGGRGTKEELDARIASAKKELEGLESKHDKLKVEERIARMTGGVAVLKVGAATEAETKYLKLKVEDSVNAVKAALEAGIVSGGGSALLLAAKAVLGAKNDTLTDDEKVGFDILASAMEAPLKNIAINCGKGDGSIVIDKVKEIQLMSTSAGYNALTDVYVEDMIAAGIIDPVKVTISALTNSASVAGVILTVTCVMAEEPKALPEGMGGQGMGM